jgi:two-component system, OmpR family, heavy metal sensor histidine kinase CusS
MLFALLCLATCGVALNLYLRYALSSSRSESMRKREHRLLRYLDSDLRMHPQFTWQQHLEHFLEATPETDLVEVDDPGGRRLYPASDPAPDLPRTTAPCTEPCLSSVRMDGHHARVLTHNVTIAGKSVRLILVGTTDEHYDILHTIDVGLLGLLPFVLLGSILGGYALSRQALLPVGQMTAQAQRLSLRHLDARISEPPTGDELQELAQAWNDMLQRLEASAQSITQFTADASHDLRTAITVILANAQLALRRERTPERYQETLASIVSEAQHMLEMLEDLLLASRSGWSTEGLAFEEVDLVAVLRETYEASLASTALREHSFHLELSLGQLWIQADAMLLRRLTSILLDNAIKYTPTGGSITMRLCGSESDWRLEVQDNGVGIALELQDRIFERLFRVDRTRPDGHGLGLAVARWITDAHGFSLDVISQPNQGSTFRVHNHVAVAALRTPTSLLPVSEQLTRR